jgi:hypothetical protein
MKNWTRNGNPNRNDHMDETRNNHIEEEKEHT